MGLLVKGHWQNEWYDTKSTDGEFVRKDSQFRSSIGEGDFKIESGRYHLFISLACPWAHRTYIFRQLKGLESIIGLTIVDPRMLDHGWSFSDVSHHNPVAGINHLYQIYTRTEPEYTGRVTVPVLWDKKLERIVNNESSDIIRLFNSGFNELTGSQTDYYPAHLRSEIDDTNAWIYEDINNGVYRAGFATSQSAYETAYHRLFSALDRVESILGKQQYLVGDEMTEADWRLFTTLIRFDSVYYSHFKTNMKQIEDYPNIARYVRVLFQFKDIAETVNFNHIKTHYYVSQTTINPTQIVPKGPVIDYSIPVGRQG